MLNQLHVVKIVLYSHIGLMTLVGEEEVMKARLVSFRLDYIGV